MTAAARADQFARPPRAGRGPRPDGMKPARTALGARLRELRLGLGFDQHLMARLVGIGPNRVSDHELGQHLPTLPMLARYAEVHDISVSELLRGVL